MMKNIQIIDGGDNATFSIFQATPEEFTAIFPEHNQDLEVVEDTVARLGETEALRILNSVWNRPVRKSEVLGLHGTLFYDYADKAHCLPSTRREADRDPSQLTPAQRSLYKAEQLGMRAKGPAHT